MTAAAAGRFPAGPQDVVLFDRLPGETPIILYTTDDLAELLSVSRGVIHQMSSAGQLPPAIKIGRRVRYDAADVREWLNTKKEK